MSKARAPADGEFDADLDEFLQERRETLETIAEGDYAFSDHAQNLLASIDGGGN